MAPKGREQDILLLTELAMDLRWTWNHCSDKLWRRLDPTLWAQTHHPNAVLQGISREQLTTALNDPEFRLLLNELLSLKRRAETAPAWFQQKYPASDLSCVVYFCMEFMLSEALPIYSGGLGNVAGDQLKAASDLGVPVTAVGLLYQHGYFRQAIDKFGAQEALYPYNDPLQMPVTPVLLPSGERLKIELAFPGGSVWLRAWQVQVGRLKLYLLDSNDSVNDPIHRGITSELYGGDPELRLKQEMVLGMGGWRLLEAIGLQPDVCHLNEGHAAFALLERARGFMRGNSHTFEVALMATRAGNLFTTHTAVPAGFDLFSPALIEQYLGNYAKDELGISMLEFMALGRKWPGDQDEPFNMAYLAIRGSGAINGVSKLHGKVSRQIFASLFPKWPAGEVPIRHITNGVHMPTWDSAAADVLWTEACGKGLWRSASPTFEADFRRVSDEKLWALRNANRAALVDFARECAARQLASISAAPESIAKAKGLLGSNILTLGFARRFAAYKRPNLILRDPDRLLRILKNTLRPVQLILAGKAHPADKAGQAFIEEWTQFIARDEAMASVMFLADYDMLMAERLVQGVDVWINTPRRPWEASGTSGMKVLVNGGINLSELDGWWAEAYAPGLGWALGDGQEHGGDSSWDAVEAEALYERLEQEVIPEFYTRNEKGIPAAWVARMRESMACLTPKYSAGRTVREYVEQHYVPAATAYRARAAANAADTRRLVDFRNRLTMKRTEFRFGAVTVETGAGQHRFMADVFLDDISPGTIRVEIYADGVGDASPVRQEMNIVGNAVDGARSTKYSASVSSGRPSADYTVRMFAQCRGLSVPLEADWIVWAK
jgi:starch phosphorylase